MAATEFGNIVLYVMFIETRQVRLAPKATNNIQFLLG